MPMNDMQALAAYGKFDKDVLVSAGAGSGKTQVLTSRVTNLIKEGTLPTELLVLTFTNAAAAEMKARVRKMLGSDESLKDSISLLEQAYITTFDSFNLSMCKKYFYKLNVSPDLSICDSSSIYMKKIEIITGILDELYEENNPLLIDYLNKFTTKKDNSLIDTLMLLINSIDKKEDSISFLEHYNDIYFSNEFINMIKNEYYDYIISLKEELFNKINEMYSYTDSKKNIETFDMIINGLNFQTFESIKSVCSIKLPIIKDEDYKILRKTTKALMDEILKYTDYESLDEALDEYKQTSSYIELFKLILIKYYKQIDLYKSQMGLYEFNDIQKLAIKLVKENEDVASELRSNFKEILIDEYQDTSDLQETFISYFKNNNRFMVGDIKQSIYKFRNANPNIFAKKYETYYSINKDNYPSQKDEFSLYDGYLIDMNQNFRSRSEVLSDINVMFSHLMSKEVGDADYIKSHQMKFGLTLYNDVKCDFDSGFNSDFIYYPYDISSKIERDYYEGFIIAKDILSKVGKYTVFNKEEGFRKATYNDFCIILDRQNHFEIFKKVLEYFSIPVVIYADQSINSSYPSMVILNCLKLVSYHFMHTFNSDYYHALSSVLRSFLFEYSDDEIYKIVSSKDLDNIVSKTCKEISYLIDTKDSQTILNEIINKFKFYDNILKISNINNSLHEVEFISGKLNELSKMGYHFTKAVEVLDGLLKSSSEVKYSLDVSTSQGVKMMNIHKSKGLEYPICYFADFNHSYNSANIKSKTGFDPKYGIYTPCYNEGEKETILKRLFVNKWKKETISERLRLFYVALTRAREKMIFIRDISNVKDSIDTDTQKSFGQYFDYLESKTPELFKNRIDLTEDYFNELDVNRINQNSYNLNLKYNPKLDYEPLNINGNIVKQDHISKRMNKISNKHLDSMLEKGLEYHYILEMLDFTRPFESLNELNIDKNAKDIIERVLNMDLMKNIYLAKTLHEYEFFSIIDNASYHGIIDLLAIYDDHIDIIDYKLKNFDDEAYDRQLSLYKKFVLSKTNKRVDCYLLSIVDATLRKVEV